MRTGARRWPSGPVSTTSAPSWSWPSRNTVAVTGKGSPTVALAGSRPRSTTGMTFMTGMRPTMRPHLRIEGTRASRATCAGPTGGRGRTPSVHLELGGVDDRAPVGTRLAVGRVGLVRVLLAGVALEPGALVLERHEPDRRRAGRRHPERAQGQVRCDRAWPERREGVGPGREEPGPGGVCRGAAPDAGLEREAAQGREPRARVGVRRKRH